MPRAGGLVGADLLSAWGSITASTPENWFDIVAPASGRFEILTTNLSNDMDTYMYLYRGTQELASDDDGGGNLASRITWNGVPGETYRVMIRHYSGSGGTGTYRIEGCSR